MSRILVTGSRFLTPSWPPGTGPLCDALDEAAQSLDDRDVTLVHGKCPPRHPVTRAPIRWDRAMDCGVHPDRLLGADWQAHRWALGRRWEIEEYPADWDRYSRGAGMIRNGEMVKLGADVAVAALEPGERCTGTRDCARRAQRAGIRVVWVNSPGDNA